MKFILDTNVVSESTKARSDERVMAWIDDQNSDDFCISVLTVGEIEKGIQASKDPRRRANLRSWLDQTLIAFEGRILPIDQRVSVTWGKTMASVGRPVSVVDSLLAGTAIAHGLTFVTRNVDDVKDLPGLEVLNPWEA